MLRTIIPSALLLIVLCVVSGIAGCAPAPGIVSRHTVDHDGRAMDYRLFTPGRTASTPAPLVVALHRFAETPDTMAAMTGFDNLAQRESFVVVYPKGDDRRFDFLSSSRDDAGAILAVVDDVRGRLPIDERRVYLTGASNGGFMTYALAHHAPERFAAIAPVMALMPERFATPDAPPVPILIVVGTEDGIVPPDAESLGPVRTLTTREATSYWRERHVCAPQPERRRVPDTDPRDGTRTVRMSWSTPEGQTPVELYTVYGGGHTWPGGNEPVPAFIVGRIARDWNATEAIWAFFQRFER
ncbi:MAG: PHB depolymerase family esterase [Phycisphaerales bacterium]